MFSQLLQIIAQLFQRNTSVIASPVVATAATTTSPVMKEETPMPDNVTPLVDWNDPTAQVSKYFTVKECTYLPTWGVCHLPSDDEKANIVRMAAIMDRVRDLVGKPIKVHVWIRPAVLNNPTSDHNGQNYNVIVGGAPNSAHIVGKAVDWDCGDVCDNTRSLLMSQLEDLGVRMENRPGSDWVHLDCAPVPPGGHRFFIP